ncbi:MAG: hypothetical protein DRQ98_12510 [Gammaproteobacteria bacterium]|nr:MAG: hypothetical protein DRQ98_12510 [Gammaproteobacteria bacterium]
MKLTTEQQLTVDEHEKDSRGYVKFLGDYSKLKGMGFTFQKLFASNYMQWERNHFRVWKKGGDITHDEYNLFKLIRFMQTHPELRTSTSLDGNTSFVFYKLYYATEFNQYDYDYHPYDKEHIKLFKDYYQAVHEHIEAGGGADDDFPEPIGDSVYMRKKDMDVLTEFTDLGWIELAYYPED